ncbi:MAG: glycosyltransferase family 39 protein [Patescibacteria group bacterium]
MIFKSTKKTVVFLVLLAITSGTFWNVKVWGDQEARGDDQTYLAIATDILDRGTFTEKGHQAEIEPLYPFFIASLYKVFGRSQDVVRVAQIIMFAATIVALYFLSKSLTTPSLALLASSISAVFYGLARPTGSLYRETLIIFFAVIIMLALYKACTGLRLVWFAVAGAVLGLYVLLNSSSQFFFVFITAGIVLVLYSKVTWKQVFVRCAVFLVALIIVLSPWIIRNQVSKADAIIAPRAGLVLLRRLESANVLYENYKLNLMGYTLGYFFSESIDPNILKKIFRPTNQIEERQAQLLKEGYSYGEIDSIFLEEFKSQIKFAPHKYLSIVLINFLHLNNPFIPDKDDLANVSTILLFTGDRHPDLEFYSKATVILTLRVGWLIFFTLTAYGIYKTRTRWRNFVFIFLYLAYINIIFSASHGIPRFALPMYPFYILLAVIGLSHILKRYPALHRLQID